MVENWLAEVWDYLWCNRIWSAWPRDGNFINFQLFQLNKQLLILYMKSLWWHTRINNNVTVPNCMSSSRAAGTKADMLHFSSVRTRALWAWRSLEEWPSPTVMTLWHSIPFDCTAQLELKNICVCVCECVCVCGGVTRLERKNFKKEKKEPWCQEWVWIAVLLCPSYETLGNLFNLLSLSSISHL